MRVAIEPHFVVFYEMPKDKEDWRKEILPRNYPEDEKKAK